jgi:hypothetical protein
MILKLNKWGTFNILMPSRLIFFDLVNLTYCIFLVTGKGSVIMLKASLLLLLLKKKGTVVRVDTMKAYSRSRGIDPLIIQLGARWR